MNLNLQWFVKDSPENEVKRDIKALKIASIILILAVIRYRYEKPFDYSLLILAPVGIWILYWETIRILEYLETRRTIPLSHSLPSGEVKGTPAFIEFLFSTAVLCGTVYVFIVDPIWK